MEQLGIAKGGYALTTVHCAANTDNRQRLTAIMEGLAASARTIVLPLHPRTKARLTSFGLVLADNVRLIDPVGYLDMIMLEKNAALIATDSGGVQKEAYFHRVCCVTFRDETEWVELVDAGWNQLVSPTDAATVASSLRSTPTGPVASTFPFGDGKSASRIAGVIAMR